MVAALGDPNLAGVVRHHHERFDGMGYPAGLEGEAIPLGARIIAVPDTFDAIITTRPYRPGLPHKDALNVLRDEAGKQFDPAVVRAFLAEYTDRRGTMIWAAAGQLIPVLRVGAVAAAEIVLSAMAFVAGAPNAHTLPRGRPAAALSSGGTPTGSGPTQPRVSVTSSASAADECPGAQNRGHEARQTQQPSPGSSRSTPTPFRAESTPALARSILSSLRPSQVQGKVAPAASRVRPARTTRRPVRGRQRRIRGWGAP